jgi:hypothetical protein
MLVAITFSMSATAIKQINLKCLGFDVYNILMQNIPLTQCKHFKVMDVKFTLDTMGQSEFLTVSNEQGRKYIKFPSLIAFYFILFVWSWAHGIRGTKTHWVTVQIVQVDNYTGMSF